MTDHHEPAIPVPPERVAYWRALAESLAALDGIASEGAVTVVKCDGQRTTGDRYTVVISRGRLGEATFHKDGPDLRALVDEALAHYAARARVP